MSSDLGIPDDVNDPHLWFYVPLDSLPLASSIEHRVRRLSGLHGDELCATYGEAYPDTEVQRPDGYVPRRVYAKWESRERTESTAAVNAYADAIVAAEGRLTIDGLFNMPQVYGPVAIRSAWGDKIGRRNGGASSEWNDTYSGRSHQWRRDPSAVNMVWESPFAAFQVLGVPSNLWADWAFQLTSGQGVESDSNGWRHRTWQEMPDLNRVVRRPWLLARYARSTARYGIDFTCGAYERLWYASDQLKEKRQYKPNNIDKSGQYFGSGETTNMVAFSDADTYGARGAEFIRLGGDPAYMETADFARFIVDDWSAEVIVRFSRAGITFKALAGLIGSRDGMNSDLAYRVLTGQMPAEWAYNMIDLQAKKETSDD